MPEHSPVGRHILLELSGCSAALLRSEEQLECLLVEGARAGGATVVSSHFHGFEPQGVSGVVVIAESHVTIHTWPEHGYAAVDVFTCGEHLVADCVGDEVVARLRADHVKRTVVNRAPAGSDVLPPVSQNVEGACYA
ncbi:adenosylmethionine decarboxylase [Sulfuriroseicoccus oceanibius]|uniref:S-adenosylmethionine decarboxylase proenzyme n=1 Tax=Sulfuriroseicoccus oceanibius TaxID=2707525 RepID=A0A6B3L4Q7_9BACT|nr:adenosylmethionine decarboxylase [Sulfuriroseicoccus oceanibius]QQL45678.1 adenosylmethionine decarboxylase [Sulfuriroseicoccus oceanibius]